MLSLIMPAYNVVKELNQVVNDVVKTLDEYGLEYEVIIVNDGSNDGTYEKALVLKKQHHNINIVGYDINRGKGYAMKYGFPYTRGDLVMFLDADSDLPPTQIPKFLEHVRKYNANVVVGSKWHPLSKVNLPKSRRYWSKGYNLMTKLLFNLGIKETQVGIKLFKREILQRILSKVMTNGYAFDIELLANAHRLGYTIVEAPIELNYQHYSRLRFKDILTIFIDTLRVFYRMRILRTYEKAGG